MSQQGYLTIASDIKSIERSVALASSIKLHDRDREFCLLVPSFSDVPKKYEQYFDLIIEFPYGNSDITEDVLINTWQSYIASPFDQTLLLNNKSLVLTDINSIWNLCEPYDLIFPDTVYNFRGEIHPMKYKFLVHEKNKIPKYFTDVCYFSKSDQASQFFKMLDVVLKNRQQVYAKIIHENRPDYFDLNLLINICIKLLGEESNIFGNIPYTLISLDNMTLDDRDLPMDWVDYYSNWYFSGKLKINNHRQYGIVCYNSDNFLTEDILNDIRSRVNFSNIEA